MKDLWTWAAMHIDLRHIFTPFAVVRTVYASGALMRSQLGYADVYVFGLRVARIQETKPWK